MTYRAALVSCLLAIRLGSAAPLRTSSQVEEDDAYASLLHISTQVVQRNKGPLVAHAGGKVAAHRDHDVASLMQEPSVTQQRASPAVKPGLQRLADVAPTRSGDTAASTLPRVERPVINAATAATPGDHADKGTGSSTASTAGDQFPIFGPGLTTSGVDIRQYTAYPGVATVYTTSLNSMDLLVDITDILRDQSQVLITASAAQGTYIDGYGQQTTLRTPLEISDNTLFEFRMAPDNSSVDVFMPVDSMRTTDPQSVQAVTTGTSAPWVGTIPIVSCAGVPMDAVIIDGMILIGDGFFVVSRPIAYMTTYHITRAASFPKNFDVTIRLLDRDSEESVSFSVLKLPKKAMEPRANDERLNYFTTSYTDVGTHLDSKDVEHRDVDNRVEMIWRYDLPNLPANQIKIYIDPTVPMRWRQSFKDGIEAWNEAFALIGKKNAVRAVLPTDSDWPRDYDAGDARYSTISWCIDHSSVFSMGIAKVDPRSGEIMKSDIIMTDGWVRAYLDDLTHLDGTITQQEHRSGIRMEQHVSKKATGGTPSWRMPRGEAGYLGERPLIGLLQKQERGEEHAESAEASLLNHPPTSLLAANVPKHKWEEVIGLGLKEIVMHETGHILGLRHNFKGSLGVDYNCTQNKSCTSINGMGSSVMDYYPLNVPVQGIDNVDVASPKIGAYDKLVIAYGYSDLKKPAPVVFGVPTELEPILQMAEAYPVCTDGDYQLGEDPLCEMHEMSSEPLVWYQAQLDQVRALQTKLLNASAAPGEPYWNYGEAVQYALSQVLRVANRLTYWIGGHNTSYAHRSLQNGTADGTVTMPISEADQRQALVLLLQIMRPYAHGLLPPEDALGYLVAKTGDGVEHMNVANWVEQNQIDYMTSIMSSHQLATLAQSETRGGMSVGQFLTDITSTVLGGASGTGIPHAPPEDWNLQATVVKLLRELELDNVHVSEDVATHVEVALDAIRSRVQRALHTVRPIPEETWKYCAKEGDLCWCLGETRYGVDGHWSAPMKTNGMPYQCSNAVFGDPIPYTRKMCECFLAETSQQHQARRLVAHLQHLGELAGAF